MIAAGSTSSTGTVTVTGVDNDVDAPDKTVKVKGAASNALGAGAPADKELAIEDDDTRGVTIRPTDLEINEGASGEYSVALTSEPTSAVTVTPSRVAGGDADVQAPGALTFTTENWSREQTATVRANHDNDSVNDAARIAHAVSGGDYASTAADTVDVTVEDDETASTGVALSVNVDEVSEADNDTTVTVTARLNGGSRPANTVVTVSVGSGTATSGTDFEAVTNFTITIAANTLSAANTFTLTPRQDTVDEPNETVNVTASTGIQNFVVQIAQITIADDDASPTTTLSLSHDAIGENGGVSTVTASLSHASSEATTVAVSVEPVAPAAAGDYTLSNNKTLTIAAGSTSSTGTVTVTGVDNDIDAPDKTVKVKGAASNALGAGAPADKELAIEDDDTRGVTIRPTDLEINEGASGEYSVALTSEPTSAVTVTPSRVAGGDADVQAPGALTFTTENWSREQTATVRANHDNDSVNDAARIAHAVSGGDYASTAADTVDVTVEDDETASTGVALSVNVDEVSEADNDTTVTVTARLNGGSRPANTVVTVSVGSGTATSGTDFEAVTNFTITIAANTLSGANTFTLTPRQDTVDEPNETVNVTASTGIQNFVVQIAQITIADDDASPTTTLSLSHDAIGENGGDIDGNGLAEPRFERGDDGGGVGRAGRSGGGRRLHAEQQQDAYDRRGIDLEHGDGDRHGRRQRH